MPKWKNEKHKGYLECLFILQMTLMHNVIKTWSSLASNALMWLPKAQRSSSPPCGVCEQTLAKHTHHLRWVASSFMSFLVFLLKYKPAAAAAAAAKSLQSCLTLCDPIDGSPPGSPHPWDPPGKNTGVGSHFLLQCMKVKSEREVAQSCPTLSDPRDCSLPGSSFHGIFQARVLEWGAIAFSHKPASVG